MDRQYFVAGKSLNLVSVLYRTESLFDAINICNRVATPHRLNTFDLITAIILVKRVLKKTWWIFQKYCLEIWVAFWFVLRGVPSSWSKSKNVDFFHQSKIIIARLCISPLNHLPLVPHMCRWTWSVMVQVMACRLFGTITWADAHLLWIKLLGTNYSEIRIRIQNFPFTKLHLKMSYGKWFNMDEL